MFTDPLTVARQNVAYTTPLGCVAPTLWTSQAAGTGISFTVTSCLDGSSGTFCHLDYQSQTNAEWFMLDLQEPRMITRVGLQTRGDCCNFREDTARVVLTNVEARPDSVIGATDCFNPGGGFPVATFRNYDCTGSAPARYVFVTMFCTAVRLCPVCPVCISTVKYFLVPCCSLNTIPIFPLCVQFLCSCLAER